MHNSTSMLKKTWAQTTAHHRSRIFPFILILKPAMHLGWVPVPKDCSMDPLTAFHLWSHVFPRTPLSKQAQSLLWGRAGGPSKNNHNRAVHSIVHQPFLRVIAKLSFLCLPEYQRSLLTVKEKRDELKIVQLYQGSTRSGKLLAPSWMWDSSRSDSTWEVVGGQGWEVPFCALSLPCMACLSLVQLQVGGESAEGKEAVVWPFSFGKRSPEERP